MTTEELTEIRAYVAERQAARARGEHIDSDERREAALLDALDEAHEEAAQWKRLAEQTTDARLAEAIASREVMLRERNEAREAGDQYRFDRDYHCKRADVAKLDLADARSRLAALHAVAVANADAFEDISVSRGECRARNSALRSVLADLATAAREHDARVRAEVEARADGRAYDLRLALARDVLDILGVPHSTEDVRDSARRVVAERDTLALALAEVRDAHTTWWAAHRAWDDATDLGPAIEEHEAESAAQERMHAALAALPADLVAQREARIRADERAKVLREAEDVCDREAEVCATATGRFIAGWCAATIRKLADKAEVSR